MAKASAHLTHPILGRLGWLPQYSHWFAQPTLPSGVHLDLVVDPFGSDRNAFLPRAAELFQWAVANERTIFATAVNAYLLELYNECWQQDDLPVLDSAGFTANLKWEFLKVSASEVVPVAYGYNPGDLFGGHTVTVEVDAALQYRGAHLIG
jgi:hypothetical protein